MQYLGASQRLICRRIKISGDMLPIPGWGRTPGGENGNALQHSCLENQMDSGA